MMSNFLIYAKTAHHDVLGRLALFFTCLMPLWLVIGRAWSDIALCIVGGLFLMHCVIKRDWKWMQTLEARLLMVFWLYMVLQSFWVAPHTDVPRLSLLFGRFFLFYLALRFWVLQHKSALAVLMGIGLPILCFVAVDGYWQYFHGVSLTGRHMTGEEADRLTGPLSHPNLGNYIFKIALPIVACALFLNRSHCRWLYSWIIIFSALLICLVPLSGERSIALMLCVCVTSAMLLTAFRMKRHRKHLCVALMALVVLIAVLATQDVIIQRSELFIAQISEFWTTVYGSLFQASFFIAQNHPLIGIGVQEFSNYCHPLLQKALVSYCDIHPHNMYLQWFVETGAIGFLLMVSFFGLLLLKAFRVYRHCDAGIQLMSLCIAIGALLGFLFPFVVTQDVFSNWPAAIFWYSLAFTISIISQHTPQRAHE